MNQAQIKSIQENIFSIRELAVELLNNPNADATQLAQHFHDRCADIESELYTIRDELIQLEYASASQYYSEDKYQQLVDEQLIERWVDSLTYEQVELALQFKQL